MDKTLPEVAKDWNALLRTLEGHSDPVNAVAFPPDGQGAGVGIERQHGRAVDAGSGAALQMLEGHSGPVNAVTFLPDGRLLASVSWDKTVRLWGQVGRGATHARNQYHYQTSLIFRGWDMSSNRQRTAGAPTYSLPVLGWIIYNPFSSPCPG